MALCFKIYRCLNNGGVPRAPAPFYLTTSHQRIKTCQTCLVVNLSLCWYIVSKNLHIISWYPQEEIMLPGPKVGLIIGKSGKTIKQLQEQSGAKMVVIQDGPNTEYVS